MRETGRVTTNFQVDRWDEEQTEWVKRKSGLVEPEAWHFHTLRVRPYDTSLDEDCNLVTDNGWNLIMKNLAGTAGTLFSATVGRIGTGNVNTAAAYTDTDLGAAAGAANRQYKLISGAPTVGTTHTQGLVFTATFGSGLGNYSWAEFGTDQGTADGTTVVSVFWNHGISNQGTKVSGQTWSVTETITWT